jgi:CheY-like chemotaxis protein
VAAAGAFIDHGRTKGKPGFHGHDSWPAVDRWAKCYRTSPRNRALASECTGSTFHSVSAAGGPRYFYPSGEPASPLSILVIDDDFAIRGTIAEILLDEGYDVRCAANGLEALAILEERALRPTLIILDLWMPQMDGLKFRELQSLGGSADVPVLVITAARLLPRELNGLGLTNVLRKPMDLDELLAKTRELIAH